MTNEEKLDAIYAMTKENHDMLKTIRRQQYFSNAARLFYWLVILGALGGVYYYVRPIVQVFNNNSEKIEQTINQFDQLKNQLPETRLLNQLLEGLRKSAESASGQ